MERLHGIFTDISRTVNEVSTWRCPYKNAQDRCTARFGCRNQLRTNIAGELPICTGSDKLGLPLRLGGLRGGDTGGRIPAWPRSITRDVSST